MLQSGGIETIIVWFVGMALIWVVIPVGIVYIVVRFLRAYERRTDAMARVEALELRLARLESQQPAMPLTPPRV